MKNLKNLLYEWDFYLFLKGGKNMRKIGLVKRVTKRRISEARKRAMVLTLAMSMMLGTCACGNKSDKETGGSGYMTESTTAAAYDGNYMYDAVEDEACYDTQASISQNGAYEAETGACAGDVDTCPTGEDVAIDYNTNEYDDLYENPWLSVKTSPLSTFAADVDTASYSNIRSNIEYGYDVPASSVRIEEMINYFHYDYDTPENGEKFAVHTEYMDCPWNEDTKLALVSLNTEKIDFSEAPESNLVFLIDVSGSMFDDNKLPLVQKSLCMLAENLTEKDRVSIVTYAGDDAVVLEGVSGDDYYTIASAIEGLEAYGSTNGAAGIETAYDLAEEYFIKGGNNRVILCTDGDLNVGVSSQGELEKLITEKKKSGVYLSVLGVGYGNYKDNKLETLADKGNGNYSYIDSIFEAKKALVDEMGATMVTVAKDVKLQVEFNPEYVKGYRLIGYENRVMAAEEFDDDTKDGGEMGAGHSVTAIYELALTDSDMEIYEPDLKYDHGDDTTVEGDEAADHDEKNAEKEKVSVDKSYELFTLNVRYKEPDEDKSKLSSYVCTNEDYSEEGSDNMRWAAAVTAFGLYLKDSQYAGDVDKDMILELATSVKDYKEDDYKAEFVSLVKKYDRD